MRYQEDVMLTIDDKEYHKDKEYISSSVLKTLYTKSPKHLLGDKTDSTAFLFGRAFHSLILEPNKFGKDYFVFPEMYEGPTYDYKGKTKGYVLKDEWVKEEWGQKNYHKEAKAKIMEENAGKQTLTSSQMEKMNGMMKSLMNSGLDKQYLENGFAEMSLFTTIDNHKYKIRMDYFVPGKNTNVIVDVKTTTSAREEDFMRECLKYGYDLQAFMYRMVAQKFLKKDVMFVFCAIEKESPYSVAWYGVPDWMLQTGSNKFQKALEIYDNTVVKGYYPGYKAEKELTFFEKPEWIRQE